MVKTILLTKGQIAFVDEAMYEELNQYKWHFNGRYAARTDPESSKPIYMHRQILHKLNAPRAAYTDHIDGNTLNNQRNNLRDVTGAQNGYNKRTTKNAVSPYKGVTYERKKQCWRAAIYPHGMRRCLGYFHDEIEAALAYDRAACIHFGEYARLNFPETKEAQNVESA